MLVADGDLGRVAEPEGEGRVHRPAGEIHIAAVAGAVLEHGRHAEGRGAARHGAGVEHGALVAVAAELDRAGGEGRAEDRLLGDDVDDTTRATAPEDERRGTLQELDALRVVEIAEDL